MAANDRLAHMADHDTAESVPTRWNAQSPDSNMWMNWDDDPRNTGAELEGERATLIDYLRAYRLILEMKCADLDAEQLARRSVPPSTMSLLGLIRHMADVERHWFRRVMAGEEAPAHYWSDEEDDADWAGAVADPAVVADAWQHWRDEVGFAERFVANADDLGVRGSMRDGTTVALREVIVHMIEEYARHAGHADLLRERVDGRVGQLSPGASGLVLAVVVVGVVLLAGAPVAARDQLGDRDAPLAGEEAADVAHRGRLARHPDPGAVGDVRRAGGRREFRAEGVAGAPVVPGDRGLRRAGQLDLVVRALDLDVHVRRGRFG